MKTLKEFLERINKVKERLATKYDCDFPIYRGHSDSSWSLTPALIRKTKKLNDVDLFIKEASLFQDFISHAGNHLKTINTWETLFLMRHHGVPTRLLDWTENLFVALYFAVLDKPDEVKEPCIWILDPYALNKHTKSLKGYVINPELEYEEYFTLFCKDSPVDRKREIPESPIAIYPFRKNERIIAQSGLFTMHGDNRNGIEEQHPGVLQKVAISGEIISEIRNIVQLAGFNRYAIYRDLDSLSLALIDFHKL